MSDKQQDEIERWIEVTGRQYPDQVTYTQDEARFWHMKCDEKVTEIDDMQRKLAAARVALRRIAWPIDWLREQAKIENKQIDGMMACHLAADANYLRGIAEKAYEATR